jgi:coenzyme F420-0:L-glutamate ligase/coenzyme F420-1:gamma-L-glutamate ligase
MANQLTIFGVAGIPDVTEGDSLPALISDALHANEETLCQGDIVVVTHKVVSIAEGRVVDRSRITPSPFAVQLAQSMGRDPRDVEVVLQESQRIVRNVERVLITETRHGLVCANAGVDKSNMGEDRVVLLPEDPDRSAEQIRKELENQYGVRLAVIISDTFGRPWRLGQTNVAIGVSGLLPFKDYRGQSDPYGNTLNATQIAVADELASAAELVMGKLDRIPVAVIRGYEYEPGAGRAKDLIRPQEWDLFR